MFQHHAPEIGDFVSRPCTVVSSAPLSVPARMPSQLPALSFDLWLSDPVCCLLLPCLLLFMVAAVALLPDH
jgi:hypothetical protein